MTPTELKSTLRLLRWSQAELARRTGYARTSVNRWCQGDLPIPQWLQDYLQCRIDIRELAQRYVAK